MDLSIELDKDTKFNVRTTALIRYKDEVLLSKKSYEDYYSLPGGRVKLGEDSKEALVRELKEELDYDIRKEELRLVRIVENFFTNHDTRFHEYLFIYELFLPEEYYNGNFKNLENNAMDMKWIRREEFTLLNVKPDLCKSIIADGEFKHVIIKE